MPAKRPAREPPTYAIDQLQLNVKIAFENPRYGEMAMALEEIEY
jgi:hypothetical protein